LKKRWADLGDYQEGRTKISSIQVGNKEDMRLCECLMNSEVSSDQLGTLREEEDQKFILMIGGIGIFLPSSPVEANACIA
jgi:hypothetical protein